MKKRWWAKAQLPRPGIEIRGALAQAMDCANERALENGRRQQVYTLPLHNLKGYIDGCIYVITERES